MKSIENEDKGKVIVAVRVRPLIEREIEEGGTPYLHYDHSQKKITVCSDKTFIFDKVFPEKSLQIDVYDYCAKKLLDSCLNGYNASLLAYGQTGSGKTYTMGTAINYDNNSDKVGVLPRAINDLFLGLEKKSKEISYSVKVSFIEIYNEELRDLLDNAQPQAGARTKNKIEKMPISIREEKDGTISLVGLVEEKVLNSREAILCLEKGSLKRSTASTFMNEASSRSHAILTVTIEQRKNKEQGENKQDQNDEDNSYIVSKFHFVDLAGSERLKKTKASGNTMKEGIKINKGLLSLGMVIAALTDDSGRYVHVPYRESKLTRILQDSLGGNSQTCMIACISPADNNLDETLSTLMYASRAQHIKNKPVVNRDPQTAMIAQLKIQISQLSHEIVALKRCLISNNIKFETKQNVNNNDEFDSTESDFLSGTAGSKYEELKLLKVKATALEKEKNTLNNDLISIKEKYDKKELELLNVQRERDMSVSHYEELVETLKSIPSLNLEEILAGLNEKEKSFSKSSILDDYRASNEKMKLEMAEKEKLYKDLQNEFEKLLQESTKDHELLLNKTQVIQDMKFTVRSLEKKLHQIQANKTEISADKQGSEEDKLKESNKGGAGNENNSDNCIDSDTEKEAEIDEKFYDMKKLKEKELNMFDESILQKEKLLQSFHQTKRMLEQNLKEELKNEYHNKIFELEHELKLVEKQRDDAVTRAAKSNNNNPKAESELNNLKNKMIEVQNKLREFKTKDKQQDNLKKLVETQQNKIIELDVDIKKFKQQKIDLLKKLKEESIQFESYKKVRNQEIINMKKNLLETKAEVSKLRNENKKKEVLLNKKKLKLGSEANAFTSTNKKLKNKKVKRILKKQQQLYSSIEDFSYFNENNLEDFLDYIVLEVDEYYKLDKLCSKELNEIESIEKRLNSEKQQLSEQILAKERLQMQQNLFEPEDFFQECKKYDINIENLQQIVESTQSKYEKLIEKVNSTMSQMKKDPKSIKLFENLFQNTALPCAGDLILKKISAIIEEKVSLEEKCLENHRNIQTLEQARNELEQINKYNNHMHEMQIAKMQEEFDSHIMQLLDYNSKELPQSQSLTFPLEKSNDTGSKHEKAFGHKNSISNYKILRPSSNTPGMKRQSVSISFVEDPVISKQSSFKQNVELELKNLKMEKDIKQLKKILDSKEVDFEKEKKLRETFQMKYSQLKNINAKDRFIGFEVQEKQTVINPPLEMKRTVNITSRSERRDQKKKLKEEQKNDNSNKNTNTNLDILNSVSLMNKHSDEKQIKKFNSSKVYRLTGSLNNTELEDDEEIMNVHTSPFKTGIWKKIASVQDVFPGPVYSMANYNDSIIVGSNKAIQTLNLPKLDISSEVAKAHASNIKAMTIEREKGLLITANEKIINIWEAASLKLINTINTSVKDIKSVQIVNSVLFCGGKGDSSTPGIQGFDLMTYKPLIEFEKNQDITSFTTNNHYLFYGCRSHVIRAMNLKTMEFSCALVDPHFDMVTSIGTMGENKQFLVSGSKDKRMKVWMVDNDFSQCVHSEPAHKEWVNKIEINTNGNLCYSGAKDGIIKIWGIENNGKLTCVSEITDYQQQITGLCHINYSQWGQDILASATQDKCVRIYQPIENNFHLNKDQK